MEQKILIVDDDQTVQRLERDYFSAHGFTVFQSRNGADALRIAYQDHPDIILLDVMMPGMDGWEVCARIRQMSDVPIIFMTGRASEADKLRGFRLGVDDYVTKPFSLAELSARVTAVLSRSRSINSEPRQVLLFGDLQLDLDKRQAKRGGEPIRLTPTEYRLLEYMARHQERAITETELSQEIWGAFREENTGALRRYIFLLRQKIEEDPANPKLILTVRGYGYRIGTEFLEPIDD